MHFYRYLRVTLLAVVALSVTSGSGLAAESYDSCVGFIDTLPTVINVQGTWCLRQNLITSASSGNMISIVTDNVAIDCNGFKIGGLGGGAATTAVAIQADSQNKLKVRHCTIQGFSVGIMITGIGLGHLVEDNLLDQNRSVSISIPGSTVSIQGSGSIVRRNTVTNTGGSSTNLRATGIDADGDIVDNVVDGISGGAGVANFSATGINSGGLFASSNPFGVLIQGNRVRNLTPKGSVNVRALGIAIAGIGNLVRDNIVTQPSS